MKWQLQHKNRYFFKKNLWPQIPWSKTVQFIRRGCFQSTKPFSLHFFGSNLRQSTLIWVYRIWVYNISVYCFWVYTFFSLPYLSLHLFQSTIFQSTKKLLLKNFFESTVFESTFILVYNISVYMLYFSLHLYWSNTFQSTLFLVNLILF